MHTAMEISQPLVSALRMSEPLPNVQDARCGTLRLLYAEHYHPVGYLVEKRAGDDAWQSLESRYFITASHAEAMELLTLPFEAPPVEAGAVASA